LSVRKKWDFEVRNKTGEPKEAIKKEREELQAAI
jgi:hypothetical protein